MTFFQANKNPKTDSVLNFCKLKKISNAMDESHIWLDSHICFYAPFVEVVARGNLLLTSDGMRVK